MDQNPPVHSHPTQVQTTVTPSHKLNSGAVVIALAALVFILVVAFLLLSKNVQKGPSANNVSVPPPKTASNPFDRPTPTPQNPFGTASSSQNPFSNLQNKSGNSSNSVQNPFQ